MDAFQWHGYQIYYPFGSRHFRCFFFQFLRIGEIGEINLNNWNNNIDNNDDGIGDNNIDNNDNDDHGGEDYDNINNGTWSLVYNVTALGGLTPAI